MAKVCTSSPLANLDAIHTELEAAMDILCTIQEAMHHGCNSIEDYASAVRGLWSYMTSLIDQMDEYVGAAIHKNTIDA